MTIKFVHELPLLGVLPQNWRVVEFGDVLDGGTRNGVYKPKEFHGKGDKIVNMGELFAHPRLFAVPMKRVQLSDSEQQRFRLEVGDLLFARRSLVASGAGKCSIICEIDEPTTFESSLIRARPDPQIADSFFLYYLFRSHYGAYILDSILRHVAVAGITGTDLVKLLIPLPSLREQKAIAHILGTLDDKIELNREMNRTLEAMARAIFKSWFVDFDPVRAKMEGRQPAGMDAATAELFPDEFEESRLGMIPKGWEVWTLGDLINIKHGYAFKGEFFRTEPPGDILLTPGNFAIGGGFKDDKFKYYVGEVPEDFVLGEGELIITMTDLSKAGDTLGYPAIIPPPRSGRYLHNQRLGKVILKPNISVSKLHLYYLLRTDTYRNEILASATGTTVKHTSPDRIKAFEFPFINNGISLIFEKIIEPLYKKITFNDEQSRTLASIRDSLLPQLLSGEIRVKESEKLLETVA